MGAWEKVKQGASNIAKGEDPGIFGNGPVISGVDNPFQSADKAWLPGAGQLNPLNSDSAVGKAVKDLGQLNVFNPDTTAGKVTKNIVADIGKDPVKWAAVAVAIAAGQPQLIPSIMSVAKLTSKNSSPEEWLTEGIKAAAIKYGGDWVAQNVAGLGPQTDITTGETFAGTGVRGATDSAMAARVAANSARGMLAAAAQKGSTDINGAQIITSSLTNDGLNQAMAQIPGWDTLSKAEQATAVNAFKVAFNKDQGAAYNLINQGFTTALQTATKEALDTGYQSLAEKVRITNEVYANGSAEDRALLNNAEAAYKTAVERIENATPTYPLTKQDLLDQSQGELEGLRRGVERVADDVFFKGKGYEGYGDFSRAANSGVDDPEVWKKIKAIEAKGGDDASTVGNAMAAYLTAQNKARSLSSDPNRDDAALAQAIEDMNAAAQAVRRLPDEISAKSKTTNVVDDLTNAGLHDDLADEVDLNKIVEGTDAEPTKKERNLSSAIENLKAGDEFEAINLLRKDIGLNPYTQDEYNAWKIAQANPAEGGDDTLTGEAGTDTPQTTAPPDDRLSQAVEKGKSGDTLSQINMMQEIFGLPAFNSIEEYEAYEEAEQAKRVTEFGKDLTGGGVQDSGVGDTKTGFYEPDASSTGAYKYDPTSGTYTYTSDDGSTLTLDADGNIVGSTEATDTPWTGLTDTATGNLNLPKLPSGKLPAVKPPAKKVTTTKPTTTTTTTGVGNTAIATGAGTTVQTGGGLNVPALLAIMSQFGQQQPQQQQQVQEPGKEFEYFDWSADPFAPKTKDKTNPTGQPKMAGGGSVDELLEILRRSGI